jgi:hypothetical protein
MKTTKLAILALLFSACADDPAAQDQNPAIVRPDAAIPPLSGALQCSAGTTACASSCVDLTTDSDNCGECGHSCRGVACTLGRCEVTVLAQRQDWPIDIAVTPADVYWVNQGAAGAVMKLGKSNLRSRPTVLADNQSKPSSIALDQTNIYWLDQGTTIEPGSVHQMPLDGGPETTIAANQVRPAQLAVAGGYLLWTNRGDGGTQGSVMKQSLSGGAPVALVPNVVPDRIAVDRKGAYYSADDDHVHIVPVLGGLPYPVQGDDTGTIRALALSPSHVYWGTFRGLTRATIGGSATETLYAGAIFALTVDARYAYFVEVQTAADGTQTFAVRRMALDASSSLELAANQGEPRALAVDDAFVYWVNYKDGTVVRVAK